MSVVNKLASFDNDIDFRRLWRVGAAISALALLASIGGLVLRGLNLGIDFEGGTSWEVIAPDVSVGDARDALTEVGAAGAKIQIVGGDTLRVQAEPAGEAERDQVTDTLAELAGTDRSAVSVSTVGPTWGDEISDKALRALLLFFIVVAIYISVRLHAKMAVGALAAMVHDIAISVGVYALFQFEITPATVIAFLTILGYSLYDTIVVFDKVNENDSRPSVSQRMTYTDLMSLSLNQVLMRSLNTTITSVIPVLAMLVIGSFVLGAVTLQEFSVALLVGLILGGYSSIFVAAPVVAWLKEREPKNRALAERLATQDARRTGRPEPEDSREPVAVSVGGSEAPPEPSGRVIPPRPRKKGRRR